MNKQEQHEADKQFLIEGLTLELVEMLMNDRGLTSDEAMALLYESDTYAKIENEHTGLYYSSAVYVYSFLQEELSRKQSYAHADKHEHIAIASEP